MSDQEPIEDITDDEIRERMAISLRDLAMDTIPVNAAAACVIYALAAALKHDCVDSLRDHVAVWIEERVKEQKEWAEAN